MKRSSCWHCFFLTVIVSTIALVLFGFIIFRLAENSYFREEIFASSDNQSAQKIEEITDNPPKIELVGDLTVKISCIDDYKGPGVKVIDDIDGDISSTVQTEMIKKNDYNYQVLYWYYYFYRLKSVLNQASLLQVSLHLYQLNLYLKKYQPYIVPLNILILHYHNL